MNRDWSKEIRENEITVGKLLEQIPQIRAQTTVSRFRRDAEKAPVILYGAGSGGRGMIPALSKLGIPLAAVCDTNLCGQTLPGFGRILSFQEVMDRFPTHQIIIGSRDYEAEIRESILSMEPGCTLWPADMLPLYYGGYNEIRSPEEYGAFLEAHAGEVDDLLAMLADEESRKVLRTILYSRLTWDFKAVKSVYTADEYFPEGIVSLSENEVLIDAGAYNGDTLGAFIKKTHGKFDKVICLEPGAEQADELARAFEGDIASGQVELIRKGLYDRETVLGFRVIPWEELTGSFLVEQDGGTQVQTTTLDVIAAERNQRPTFLKMDIEGSELAALHGAEKTIRMYKPKLAICIYHRMEDIVTIPQYIASLHPNYRFYIRHHSLDVHETVLYAIP